MIMELLSPDSVHRLEDCILGLADHHNSIPSAFSGIYPFLPVDSILSAMADQVRDGRAVIEIISDDGKIAGFSKVSFDHTYGILDFLFVREEYRGRGYGKILMDRVMDLFRQRGVDLIDIKVVSGNDAERFYQRYGFQIRSVIMTRRI